MVLGLAGYRRFSLVCGAILFLFLVRRKPAKCRTPIRMLARRAGYRWPWFAFAVAVIGALSYFPRSGGAGQFAFIGIIIFLLVVTVATIRVPPGRLGLFSLSHPALIGAVVVFLSGVSPYLGWRTLNAFSMYSNLRTEGDVTNHLLIPASVQPFSFQTDLVEIESSNVRELQLLTDGETLIPFAQMRSALTTQAIRGRRGLSVTYWRGGRRFAHETAESAPELAIPQARVIWKIQSFRPVKQVGPMPCTL